MLLDSGLIGLPIGPKVVDRILNMNPQKELLWAYG